MRLLGEIALFMVAAALLGFGAGWLTWRAGRRPVPEPQWRRLTQQTEHLERTLAEAQARLAQQDAGRRRAEEEAQRTRQLLERAWADKDQLQARLDLLERETATARHQRDLATDRLGQLQRRLAQLSVTRARATGVPNGVLPTEHAPPDPARIGLTAMPAPPAPPAMPGPIGAPDAARPPGPPPLDLSGAEVVEHHR